MYPLAVRAPVRQTTVFLDLNGNFLDFDLLNHARGRVSVGKRAATVGAALQGVVLRVRDLFRRESRTLMAGMAFLGSAFRFLRPFLDLGGLTISLDGGLDDVRDVFRAAANWVSNSATRACKRAHSGHPVLTSCTTMIPTHYFIRRIRKRSMC